MCHSGTEDHVAGRPAVAHAPPPPGARLVVGSRLEITSAICPEPRSWSICAFLRGRTVCFHLCHLKAGLLAPKGSARPAWCAGALAARGASYRPQDWKGPSKRGRSARPSAPLAFVSARPARGLRKGLFKWLPGNKGGPGARLHYRLIGHTGRPPLARPTLASLSLARPGPPTHEAGRRWGPGGASPPGLAFSTRLP